MNKKQLAASVAEKTGITKTDAEKYVNAVVGAIADNICEGDNEVQLPDFGRFYVKTVPSRQGTNPATGEKMTIEAHDKIVFKPSDNMYLYSRKHPVEK